MKPEMVHTGPFFEYRQVYQGLGESLQVHLRTRLQPWRWPIMLSTGGIRVEVGAKALTDMKLEYPLKRGDVVVIDDAYGKTWLDLMHEATINFRDYVFCPQRARDRFLLDQVKALLMEKTAQEVPWGESAQAVPNLYALVEKLLVLADHPIRHLVLVGHANPFGDIQLPMRDETDGFGDVTPKYSEPLVVNWESLQQAIETPERNPLQIHESRQLVDGKPVPRRADGTQDNRFPTVLPRPVRPDGKFVPFAVIIRGCSAGVHTILLNKIRQAFGHMVDIVVMPKCFGATHTVGREMLEYFQHDLSVTSPTPLTRDKVIQAFKDAKLTDWLGDALPDSEWSDLVPPYVTAQTTAVKELTVGVKGRDGPLALMTWFDTGKIETTGYMEQKDKPDAAAIQKFLIDELKRRRSFRSDTGDWPIWLRLGLSSLEEFIAYFTYEVDSGAEAKPGKWAVHGQRYFYRIRTPLIEKGLLVANHHPGGDGAQATRTIDYNDDRIFGRSDPDKKSDPGDRVGDNFSRLL